MTETTEWGVQRVRDGVVLWRPSRAAAEETIRREVEDEDGIQCRLVRRTLVVEAWEPA